jgi:hypothetical protein
MKDMKITTYFSIISILLICAGCPDQDDKPDSTLTIRNNSNEDIINYIEYRVLGDTLLPATSLFPSPNSISPELITSNSERNYRDSWLRAFEDNPDKILMLYLFSRDTIEQVAWERIREDNVILRRYDLTLADLEAMDWTVEYP